MLRVQVLREDGAVMVLAAGIFADVVARAEKSINAAYDTINGDGSAKPAIGHPIITDIVGSISAFVTAHAGQFPGLVADIVAFEQASGSALKSAAFSKLLSDLALLTA